MNRKTEPTIDDIRGVFRLLNECCEMWADPEAWQAHLLTGVRRVLDGTIGHLHIAQPQPGSDRPNAVPLAWSGEHPRGRELYERSIAPDAEVDLPSFGEAIAPVFQGGALGITRRMSVPDELWYQSTFYREYVEPLGADEFATGISAAPAVRGLLFLGGSRVHGADAIEPVKAATLAILTEELAALIGTRLALADQKSMAGLSPRQRETLELLLDGLSEKQVAAEMGVKLSTAHTYVVQLHKHFDVQSRGELMSYFVRRQPD